MEIDPSSNIAEKPDQATWSCDDQNLLDHVITSYKCSFCRRGFSNAQALGGHMNIHRKDRARLKQISSHDNNISLLNITKRDALNRASLSVDGHDPEQPQVSRDEKVCTQKRDFTSRDQEIITDPEDQQQLSLFIEASSSNNDKEENNRVTAGKHAKKSMQYSSHGESLPELDLELRLGPEPHRTSRKG